MQILYILQNGDTNQYKIGITNNLNRRLKQLQSGCPYDLKVIKIWTHYDRKVIAKYERVLHKFFTKCGCRIRNNGEWFILTRPDIFQLCKPQTIPEQNEIIKKLLKML